jgi:hypothetical protein
MQRIHLSLMTNFEADALTERLLHTTSSLWCSETLGDTNTPNKKEIFSRNLPTYQIEEMNFREKIMIPSRSICLGIFGCLVHQGWREI